MYDILLLFLFCILFFSLFSRLFLLHTKQSMQVTVLHCKFKLEEDEMARLCEGRVLRERLEKLLKHLADCAFDQCDLDDAMTEHWDKCQKPSCGVKKLMEEHSQRGGKRF